MDAFAGKSLDEIIAAKAKERKPQPKPRAEKAKPVMRREKPEVRGRGAAGARPFESKPVVTERREHAEPRGSLRKLFIGTFTSDVTDENIRSLFTEDFLRVKEVALETTPKGNQFLIATFERDADGEAAIQALNGKRVSFASQGRPLTCKPYTEKPSAAGGAASAMPVRHSQAPAAGAITVVKRTSAEHPANAPKQLAGIKVSGLPGDLKDEELQQIFASVGRILSSKALGRSHVGFVVFDRPASVTKAIKEFDGALINGREITVEVDPAPRM